MFMVILWAVWMLCRIYISGCLLRKLPYVPNRYQQLSYRFFGLQVPTCRRQVRPGLG